MRETVAIARAFVTYSLVPYLGILFCPGAVLMGGVALVKSLYAPSDNRDLARPLVSIVLGLVLLAVQLLLWWILYKAPEWAQNI